MTNEDMEQETRGKTANSINNQDNTQTQDTKTINSLRPDKSGMTTGSRK
jgi:hypothetical protein